ncbi:hypothetical protein ACFVIM_03520 [Streptomyces sp. NPDC057638]|uniref:hypothetical protein n=1 Tax=Streptomyces sp. NPDC057638 TaxID=3346190 RepID=UPI003693D760
MIARLLRLYPPGYRAAYGGEIADTYREMTAGLPRRARLREAADLAAHALRVRTGLGPADDLGRFLASAAPFALVAAAVVAAIRLTRWWEGLVVSPSPVLLSLRTLDAPFALGLLSSLLVCAGAVVALTGRWAAGVTAAVCGLLVTGALALTQPWLYGDRVVVPVVALLTIAVVLACPPELRPGDRVSAVAVAMGGAAWVPVVAVEVGVVSGVSTEYGAWPLLVLTATGVVCALRAHREQKESGRRGPGGTPRTRPRASGLRETAAMIVASPPLVAHALDGVRYGSGPDRMVVLALTLPVLALLVTAVRARSRTR